MLSIKVASLLLNNKTINIKKGAQGTIRAQLWDFREENFTDLTVMVEDLVNFCGGTTDLYVD